MDGNANQGQTVVVGPGYEMNNSWARESRRRRGRCTFRATGTGHHHGQTASNEARNEHDQDAVYYATRTLYPYLMERPLSEVVTVLLLRLHHPSRV